MDRPINIILCICLLACSPYKKVTLTMSDRLTHNWKGSTEGAVLKAIGSYKVREPQSDGYFLRFDYSYLLIRPERKTSDIQARISNQGAGNTQSSSHSYPPEFRSADDSVIKRMEFYFDNAHHVQYVMAWGYPDSIYYIKRK